MNEIQPAVKYRVVVLSKDSGNVISHRNLIHENPNGITDLKLLPYLHFYIQAICDEILIHLHLLAQIPLSQLILPHHSLLFMFFHIPSYWQFCFEWQL